MTSLARYEAVLVAGPHGLHRVKLLRTPLKQSAPNRDALPLNVPFAPETSTPPLPSWWLARQGQPIAAPAAPAAPPATPDGENVVHCTDWRPPDGAALKTLRGALSQHKAAGVGGLHRGLISELEAGKRSVGKGISAANLYRYVEALQAHMQAVADDGG